MTQTITQTDAVFYGLICDECQQAGVAEECDGAEYLIGNDPDPKQCALLCQEAFDAEVKTRDCLLYTSPSPRD